jgi:hypothetical protein
MEDTRDRAVLGTPPPAWYVGIATSLLDGASETDLFSGDMSQTA